MREEFAWLWLVMTTGIISLVSEIVQTVKHKTSRRTEIVGFKLSLLEIFTSNNVTRRYLVSIAVSSLLSNVIVGFVIVKKISIRKRSFLAQKDD